jgi:hypothetical protein
VIDARERELQQRQKDEKKEKKDRGEGWAAGPDGGPKLKIESSSETVPGSGFGPATGSGFGAGIRTGTGTNSAPFGRDPGRLTDPSPFRNQ